MFGGWSLQGFVHALIFITREIIGGGVNAVMKYTFRLDAYPGGLYLGLGRIKNVVNISRP